jgi:hypothetical protein
MGRIFLRSAAAGLLILSTGYTWTVGQSGLEATNHNLCDLVNSLSPWAFDGCRVQLWIVALWGALCVAAAVYLVWTTLLGIFRALRSSPLPARQQHPVPSGAVQRDRDATAPERIFVPEEITPEYLIGLFNVPDRTTLQAERDVEPFLGKWITVSGEMADLERHADVSFVSMFVHRKSTLTNRWFMVLYFRGKSIDRAMLVRKGAGLRAIGRIDRVSSHSLSLDPSELIDAVSPTASPSLQSPPDIGERRPP